MGGRVLEASAKEEAGAAGTNRTNLCFRVKDKRGGTLEGTVDEEKRVEKKGGRKEADCPGGGRLAEM